MLNIDDLVAAAKYDRRNPTQHEGEIPSAIHDLVKSAFEKNARVRLPVKGRDAYEEVKALILSAARAQGRSAWISPIHETHLVLDDDGTELEVENKAGKILEAVFTIGAKRGPRRN